MQNIEASEAPATVAIRPATLSDCPFLSKIFLLASRSHLHKGFYEAMLGDDVGESEVRSLMQEWLEAEGPSYYSYKGYIIAEVNGQPAAGSIITSHCVFFGGGEVSINAVCILIDKI